jgi:hypothetical protein
MATQGYGGKDGSHIFTGKVRTLLPGR